MSVIFGDDIPTSGIVLRVAVDLAKKIFTTNDTSEKEKIELIQTTLREAIHALGKLTPEQRDPLLALVDDIVPHTVTLVVDACHSGDFLQNKPVSTCCIPSHTKNAKAPEIRVPTPVKV
jgi:hypothetical protein